jgi:ubiquinone/menaquinone biosynthesis C-methylase UbiE
MVNRVAQQSGLKRLTCLEVAAGSGELPEIVRQRLLRRGIVLDITLLDMAQSHLPAANCAIAKTGQNRGVVGDALRLPFANEAFDVVSCNLFAHHLNPQQLQQCATVSLGWMD